MSIASLPVQRCIKSIMISSIIKVPMPLTCCVRDYSLPTSCLCRFYTFTGSWWDSVFPSLAVHALLHGNFISIPTSKQFITNFDLYSDPEEIHYLQHHPEWTYCWPFIVIMYEVDMDVTSNQCPIKQGALQKPTGFRSPKQNLSEVLVTCSMIRI